jgi:hypothetical protein
MPLTPIVGQRYARHLMALFAGCVVGVATGTAYADWQLPIYICKYCHTYLNNEYCAYVLCFGTSHSCSGQVCPNDPMVVRACCGGECPDDDWLDTCASAGQ